VNRPPALPDSVPRWQRGAAVATHRLLYGLLVAAPLAGWMLASATGLSVNWFGMFQVPDLLPRQPGLAELLKAAHKGAVALLALLVLGHAGMALCHALVFRDGVMHRMLPWKPRSTT
jgi:cytochrome b561